MLLVIASSLLSFGCGKSTDRAVEQTAEQTYEIDPEGAFSLRNAAGSVRILGSDDAGMKIKTTKKAWNAEQLNAIAARVSVQSKSVSIETSFPPQERRGGFPIVPAASTTSSPFRERSRFRDWIWRTEVFTSKECAAMCGPTW